MTTGSKNDAYGNSGPIAPSLNIPELSTIIRIKIIDICTISNVPAKNLFTPQVNGLEKANACPSLVFLLEHPSGQKILFDLGIRKDWENLDPAVVERLKGHGYGVEVETGIPEFLDDGGVGKENIDAVIWSHAHWDHTGDMSKFESKTELVVGPGFKVHFLGDGKGNSALGGVLPSDVEGRNVREITFQEGHLSVLRVGQFPAFDYFQDGSLYLFDSPGHCVGHLCALVRTSTNPATFVFLGGDAAHHCGEIRPSAYVPMPDSVISNPIAPSPSGAPPLCARPWFESLQMSRNRNPKGPLFQPAFGHDMDQVLDTIRKIQEYDGDSNILVILAHDSAFRAPDIPRFPKAINEWKAAGLGDALRWRWIADVWRESSEVGAT